MTDRWALEDRVAVVTGASGGLGLGCAHALAQAGATVLMVARSPARLELAAEDVRARSGAAQALAGDVTEPEAVEAAVVAAERLGDLRVCVTAAGTNRPAAARDYPLADWDALFDVNVRATFIACRAVARRLLDRGVPGSIVTLSSQMGAVGYPGRAAYCATKHAVEGLTKALAVEWAASGIRVNAVAPTFVRTPMTEAMLNDPHFSAEVERRLPTKQLATVQQVADAVRYLSCDASGSVTGAVLRVDGGWTAW